MAPLNREQIGFSPKGILKKPFLFNLLQQKITHNLVLEHTENHRSCLVFNLLVQFSRFSVKNLTLWFKEATDGKSSSPLCPFGAMFPTSSTNINLIKRQWLASEQTNMLISIDEGAWEQFMCINEVKNWAKQSYPASFGISSQPHVGLPNDLRIWTWAEFNRPLVNGFVQQLCTVIMYSSWCFCKSCE